MSDRGEDVLPPYEVARMLVDAIVAAGIAGRDPVTRAELEHAIEAALVDAGLVVRRG